MTRGAGSAWSAPETVAGFVRASPNETLLAFAAEELRRGGSRRAVDLGCGAGRNALPLARADWNVVGLDTSWPMLVAAARRARDERLADRVLLVHAAMDALPLPDASCDLVVAHGVWNLARSGAEMRGAIAEAGRVARPGAGLFLFTFSRRTLPPDARPVAGESFVFTQFSGEPQCFLTADELVAELAAGGFAADAAVPLRELNAPLPGAVARGGPVIYEGTFSRSA
jgi:SAM-dependent methyltransferase